MTATDNSSFVDSTPPSLPFSSVAFDSSREFNTSKESASDAMLIASSRSPTSSSITSRPRSVDHDSAPDLKSDGLIDASGGSKWPGARRLLVVIAMAFLWSASQIPLFFWGGLEPQILNSLGGYDKSTWIGLGYLLPLGIVTPFVGTLSDLFGRKIMAVIAFLFIIVGTITVATAQSIDAVIAGTALTGVGGGIGELVGLAVVGEITPAKERGLYVGSVHLSILPFAPSVLYAQLIARSSSWRWCGLLISVWCLVGLILTLVFYQPAPRNSEFTRRELAKQIDYVGGLLSAAGLTLFLLGLVFGAEGAPWTSAKVLAPFFLGVAIIVAFVVWESRFVKYPMFPTRLKENPRALAVILIITFASGANYFSTLLFWPTEYQTIYAQDNAVSAGIGSLPTGFGIIIGGMIGTLLVSILRKQIRWLMVFCTALMTAANGALACGTPDNLSTLWPIVSLASLGVGLTIVPNQVIAGIVCPTDLIATITAATIAIRIIGGAISYAIYYAIYAQHFRSLVPTVIAPAAAAAGVGSPQQIGYIAQIIANGGGFSHLDRVPGIVNQTQIDLVTRAGKLASSQSYSQVYYVSIAFGVVSFVASFFLTGVDKDMEYREEADRRGGRN